MRDAWSHGGTFNYIASSGEHTAASRYQKPYHTLHLRTAWTSPRDSWLRGTQFALGLDDVLNEMPPLFLDHPISFNYGVIPRPQGRFLARDRDQDLVTAAPFPLGNRRKKRRFFQAG